MKTEPETTTKQFASEEPGAIVYTIPEPGVVVLLGGLPEKRMVTSPEEGKKFVVRPNGLKDIYNPGDYADTREGAVSKGIARAWEDHLNKTQRLFEWIEKIKNSLTPF